MSELEGWLSDILEGRASAQIKDMASRGLLPFPPVQMLRALAALASDPEESVRRQARESAAALPRTLLLSSAASRESMPAVLGLLADCLPSDEGILARLAANPATAAGDLERLASKPSPGVLDALAHNQESLRRNPAVVRALLMNQALPARLRGYLKEEMERQEAVQKAQVREVEEELSKEEEPEVRFDEVVTRDFDQDDEALPPAKRLEAQEARHRSVFQVIRSLNAGEKLILAMKGNKEARYLLIRDSNKQVATKVLESPRLSDLEVETFAKMTNVCDEVLRGIAANKQWMGKYAVTKALAFNPKTPVGISLPMVTKLTIRDLGLMTRNRNIPEVIRQTAQRLYRQRRESRTGPAGH